MSTVPQTSSPAGSPAPHPDSVDQQEKRPKQRRGRGRAPSLTTRLGLLLLFIFVFAAICAPLLARADPGAQDLSRILEGPSAAHLLGTDDLGRDIWSRLVYGARTSLLAALIAVGVAVLIGVPVGLLGGFLGGWVDAVLMRFTDAGLAFPPLVLAIAIGAVLGPGLVNSMVAVGCVFAPTLARLARGQVMATKERLFISVAFTYGASHFRVLTRHIFPNIVQPMIIQVAILMGTALLAEASLSFLGLGVQAPGSSWGTMLYDSFRFIAQVPYQIYAPGLAIAGAVISFNALGDAIRDRVDARSSS